MGVLIVYQCFCHPSTFSNIFSETTEPIELNFHLETPFDGGIKVCSNGPGHMTKQKADDFGTWYAGPTKLLK